MNRRGFLTGMLALGAAPAICKAENLMKVFVPPEKKLIIGRGFTQPIIIYDELGLIEQRLLSTKHLDSPNRDQIRQELQNKRDEIFRQLAADFDGDTMNVIKHPDGDATFSRYPTLDRAVWGQKHQIPKDSKLVEFLNRHLKV